MQNKKTIQQKSVLYFYNMCVTFSPTLMDSLFTLLATSQQCIFMFLCLAQMKNHPGNMQGQLNNVSHAPASCCELLLSVQFCCFFYWQYRHAGSQHEGNVPALISHLKRISCYKPIDACGVQKKKGAYFHSQWHKHPEQSPLLIV